MKLTQDFLNHALDYNSETGEFTWKERFVCDHFPNSRSVAVFNSRFPGLIAGSRITSDRSATSYIAIQVLGKSYKAHRLAFLIMEDRLPEEVDHMNNNGMNNKWLNLRASDRIDNSRNLPKQKSNKTGVIGVNWHKAAGKWQARAVDQNGKRIDLGRFDDFDDAVKARKEHEILFGYYENRD